MAIMQSGTEVLASPHDGCPTAADIAEQSARVVRFGGAIPSPLLHHLWLVGVMAYCRTGLSVEAGVLGLLHDAHEVVTGEVVFPFKPQAMRAEQDWLDAKIRRKFLQAEYPEFYPVLALVKECDLDACDLEAAHFALPNYAEVCARTKERPVFESEEWSRFVHFLFYAHTPEEWSHFLQGLLELAEAGEFNGVGTILGAVLGEFQEWNARLAICPKTT